MIFRYRKIKLSLYNRKKAETETNIFNSMANFLINDLVIKSNNPKFARRPKVGVVYAERDTQKTIINYAFNSILSGMLSTLGINKKEQRKERREFKKEEKQNSWKSF
jgi:ABC-type molybdenum transport system ATPase subunit/photorepair protein PhrA